MSEQAQPNPDGDNLWQQFDAVEAQKQEELEAAYQQVEGYNAQMLNQVAGIEDTVFQVNGVIKDGETSYHDGQPEEIRGKSFMSLLYLQPDRQEQLSAQGEHYDTIKNQGDPHVIRGEVPERSNKLLQNLLESIDAKELKHRSSPNLTVWRGSIAGEPIEIDIHNAKVEIDNNGKKELVDSLWAYVCRADDGRADEPVDPVDIVSTESDTTIGINNSDEDKTTVEESGTLKNLRRRIFPKRRKF